MGGLNLFFVPDFLFSKVSAVSSIRSGLITDLAHANGNPLLVNNGLPPAREIESTNGVVDRYSSATALAASEGRRSGMAHSMLSEGGILV